MTSKPEFSYLIDCKKIGKKNKSFNLTANKTECEALARRFELLSLNSLEVRAEVRAMSRDCYFLKCNFSAEYHQQCVITNKPLKRNISCTFDRSYCNLSNNNLIEKRVSEDFKEIVDDLDLPDNLINDCFDLGESVSEQLSLEIEPFPREIGAEFKGYSSYDDEQKTNEKTNPFDVLKQLNRSLDS